MNVVLKFILIVAGTLARALLYTIVEIGKMLLVGAAMAWCFSCFGLLFVACAFADGYDTLGWLLLAVNPAILIGINVYHKISKL